MLLAYIHFSPLSPVGAGFTCPLVPCVAGGSPPAYIAVSLEKFVNLAKLIHNFF
jgi:hypothetical protein